jgi:hypothetical protein
LASCDSIRRERLEPFAITLLCLHALLLRSALFLVIADTRIVRAAE